MCTSFQRDFNVEEANIQMFIIIFCWGKMKCDLVDLLDILLGLHTSQSGCFWEINSLCWSGRPYLVKLVLNKDNPGYIANICFGILGYSHYITHYS